MRSNDTQVHHRCWQSCNGGVGLRAYAVGPAPVCLDVSGTMCEKSRDQITSVTWKWPTRIVGETCFKCGKLCRGFVDIGYVGRAQTPRRRGYESSTYAAVCKARRYLLTLPIDRTRGVLCKSWFKLGLWPRLCPFGRVVEFPANFLILSGTCPARDVRKSAIRPHYLAFLERNIASI